MRPSRGAPAHDDRVARPAFLFSLAGGEAQLLADEVEHDALPAQAVDAEHALRSEVLLVQSGRTNGLDGAAPDPQPGNDDGRHLPHVGHAGQPHVARWSQAQQRRELARDDGALGTGVDDEAERTLAAHHDRQGHAAALVRLVSERLLAGERRRAAGRGRAGRATEGQCGHNEQRLPQHRRVLG